MERLTNLKIIDISENLFNDWEYVLNIIENKKDLDFFIITGNSLASYEHKEIFTKKNQFLFDKLIWIPSEWVGSEHWKTLAKDESLYSSIMNTHIKYYNI